MMLMFVKKKQKCGKECELDRKERIRDERSLWNMIWKCLFEKKRKIVDGAIQCDCNLEVDQ